MYGDNAMVICGDHAVEMYGENAMKSIAYFISSVMSTQSQQREIYNCSLHKE